MFVPYLLTLRNFQSFGSNETEISLDFKSPTLIVGRNHDSDVDGQLDSNGAGKSTIKNSISYALYGAINSDKTVNADEIINNINKKNLHVTLTFSVKEGEFYKVERYRKNKALGGNGVRILHRVGGKPTDAFDPDKHDITPDSIANADALICQIMGMTFEVFSRIVAFSATNKPFLFLPAGEQTAIVEDITGLTELTEKAELLKKRTKADRTELARLEEINTTIKAQRGQIIAQVESAKKKSAEWEDNRTHELEVAHSRLHDLEGQSVDYDEQLEFLEAVQTLTTQIEGHQAKIREYTLERKAQVTELDNFRNWGIRHADRIDVAEKALAALPEVDTAAEVKKFADIRDLTERMQANQDAIKTKEQEVARLEKVIAERKKELAHLRDATCPYCSQSYKESLSKAVEVEALIELDEKKVNAIKIEIDSLELASIDYPASIARIQSTLVFEKEVDAMLANNRRQVAESNLRDLASDKNPYDVDEAEAEGYIADIDKAISKLESNITKKQKSLATYKAELVFKTATEVANARNAVERLQAEVARLEAAQNPLASTVAELEAIKLEDTKDDEIAALEDSIEHQQFLVKLLTKKDSFVRKVLLQKSIPFLNTRLRYYLDKIGLPHRVAFQEDLSVKISQFGNGISFALLSTGQKARVNLALSFAFRDMLQARFGKLKFVVLDECLDVGLGNVGVQLAAKMIKAVATEEKISMFIISHRDEITNMFDKKLVVELRGGFSSIAEQD
jgi:DNA repair exonuclease SbcCD ATPase subunit